MKYFEKLGLSSQLSDVVTKMGFEKPTPVQEEAIPILLQHDPTDFIGLAQTGTGKTAAFGLPLIELIDSSNSATQALIMAPTRELGQQTAQQLNEFSREHKKLNVEVVYGGANISAQIKALKRPTHIIVATPGRLLDLIRRKAVRLNDVRFVVLDEADEMLNMGFKEDIDSILSFTKEDRSTWLFSATMPGDIRKIIKKYMTDPKEVSVNKIEKTNKDITHTFVVTKTSNKFASLRRFLDIQPEMRGILFCRTKRETQQIADDLGNLGYGVEALHGDLSQAQRDAVMKRFKTRSMQLLIATDVAARGIDVNDLTHVMHHTLPDQLESYTHRSGRTGRAGKKGISLAFINPREERKIRELEKRMKISFTPVEVPSLEEMKSSRINHWADLIVNTKVDKQAEQILNSLYDRLGHLSKDELLQRLITTQLDHLVTQGGENSNLNESAESPKKRRKDINMNRYFVNVGSIDGLTKGDLIHFLSDSSGISRRDIEEVNMQKNCAYFSVDATKDKGLSKKFQGIEIKGRSIRVNRDDDGRKRDKRPAGVKNKPGGKRPFRSGKKRKRL